MKTLNIIGWASAGIGIIAIILGLLSAIIGKKIFSVSHIVNFFHLANTFFLLTIALFIVVNKCECNRK